MDDQQERPVGLDFVAGLVTGEGSFCIAVQRMRGDRFRFIPIFSMAMTDTDTMEIVAQTMKDNGLPVYMRRKDPTHPGAQPQVEMRIAGYKRIQPLLESLIPYLTGTKKQSAILVSQFVALRADRPANSKPSEDEFELIRRLRIMNGNRRGKKTPLESPEAIRRTELSRL